MLPWADPPTFDDLTGSHVLAGTSALAAGGLAIQFGTDLVDRTHVGARQHLRREVEDADAAHAPAADGMAAADVVFGWRWSGVGIALLCPAIFGVIGVLLVLAGAGLAGLLWGIASLAFAAALAGGLVFSAIARPRHLVIGPSGVNVAERGTIPWAAVSSCVLERGGGVGLSPCGCTPVPSFP